jgi:hypothetical protein
MGMAAGPGVLNGKLLKGRGIRVGIGGVWHARDKPQACIFVLLPGFGPMIGYRRQSGLPKIN